MTKQELEKLIKECEEAGLSPWQIVEVKLGNYMGLTREEILTYAKKENEIETMERLRMQLQFPETSEVAQEFDQLKEENCEPVQSVHLPVTLDYEKLEHIMMKAVNQVSVTISAALEQIQNTDTNTNVMKELNVRIAELMYENKVLKERRTVWNLEEPNSDKEKSFWSRFRKKKETIENRGILELLAGSGELYNDEQIKELSLAYENGLSMQSIYKLANPELDGFKMKQIRLIAERLEGLTTGQQEEISDNDQAAEMPEKEELPEEEAEMQIPESESGYYVLEEDEAFSIGAEEYW